MTSICYVTNTDYKQHFRWMRPPARHEDDPVTWSGPDRRVALGDRRQPGHERRWDASRGRRFRFKDRRRSTET